jgi:hypothetical protein
MPYLHISYKNKIDNAHSVLAHMQSHGGLSSWQTIPTLAHSGHYLEIKPECGTANVIRFWQYCATLYDETSYLTSEKKYF